MKPEQAVLTNSCLEEKEITFFLQKPEDSSASLQNYF
jgi:hypothetical protein